MTGQTLTYRMVMILEVIAKRNPDGTLVDLDQIIERVDYPVTKASIQFTLRAMIKRKLIDKAGVEIRRRRNRVVYRTTDIGQMHYHPAV